jgi:transcription elongation factor Elf1
MAQLILTEKEKKLATWLELDDESLGKFVKANILQVLTRSKEDLAVFTLSCATALCAIANEANAGKLELTLDNLKNKTNTFGNWKVTVKKMKQPMNKAPISQKSKDIIAYRKKYPCLTLQAVGDKFGITRERVRQILDRASSPTRHYIKPKTLYTCLNCGKETTYKIGLCSRECRYQYNMIPLVCDNCGVVFHRKKSLAIRHNTGRYKGKVFCNRDCMHRYEHKHPFYNPIKYDFNSYNLELFKQLYLSNNSYKDINNKMNINNKECAAIAHYLDLTRPRIKTRDWKLIKKLYLKKISCVKISEITKIPIKTVYNIIHKMHEQGKLRVYLKRRIDNGKQGNWIIE